MTELPWELALIILIITLINIKYISAMVRNYLKQQKHIPAGLSKIAAQLSEKVSNKSVITAY